MSKAEKFIKDYTRNCSNQLEWNVQTATEEISYFKPWLTPNDARRAVEIAREEIYEWLSDNFFNYFEARMSMFDMCLEDLKQAMKDE